MELDVKKILSVFFSRIWLIISVTVAGGILFFLINAFFTTPIYTSQATLYVTNMSERKSSIVTSSDVLVSKELVATCIVILNSRTVLDKVSEELNFDYTSTQLKSMISAQSVSETEIFRIQVRNSDPQEAQRIAQAILTVAPAEIKRVLNAGSVSIIDYATLPVEPSSPNIPKNTILGAIFGAAVIMLAIFVFEVVDTRVKSEFDLVEEFDLPILGVIPSFKLAEKSNLPASTKEEARKK